MPIRPVKGDNHQHEKEHLWHWRDATVQLSNVITMKPRSMPTWHAFNQEGRTPIHGRWGMTPSNKQSGTPRRIRSRIAYKTKRKDFHVSNKGMGATHHTKIPEHPPYQSGVTPIEPKQIRTKQPSLNSYGWQVGVVSSTGKSCQVAPCVHVVGNPHRFGKK